MNSSFDDFSPAFLDFAANFSDEAFPANTSDEVTEDLMYSGVARVAFYSVYGAIFLLGLLGNCLVCYVVFRTSRMRTVTNFFIASLAVADILLCLFTLPLTAIYFFMRRWVFGSLLCHVLPMAQGASIYISSLTLTAIACDRYFVILYPFRPRMSVKKCYFTITWIWIFSILMTSPYGVYMTTIFDENSNATYCTEQWPSNDTQIMFSLFTPNLQFLLPYGIIIFCYVKISLKLDERGKPGQVSSRREEADKERKRRTNRMLIAMVAIFGISWLPINVINLSSDFFEAIQNSRFFNLSFFLAHVLAMSSTCYNPFLYAWLNENFRREFQQILPCFSRLPKDQLRYTQSKMLTQTCNGMEKETKNIEKKHEENSNKKEIQLNNKNENKYKDNIISAESSVKGANSTETCLTESKTDNSFNKEHSRLDLNTESNIESTSQIHLTASDSYSSLKVNHNDKVNLNIMSVSSTSVYTEDSKNKSNNEHNNILSCENSATVSCTRIYKNQKHDTAQSISNKRKTDDENEMVDIGVTTSSPVNITEKVNIEEEQENIKFNTFESN